ncbi:hypothetical protein ACFLTR_03715 [Chloroflexota bacterium]
MVDEKKERKTKEELVSDLMYQAQMLIWGRNYPDKKRLAVERYMRSFISALTLGELQSHIGLFRKRGILQYDIVSTVDQASEGYDDYVMGNRKRYPKRPQT